MRAFIPRPNSTVNVNVSTSSQPTALCDACTTVRIANDGTATVWYEIGGSAVAASTSTSAPLAAGGVEVVSIGNIPAGGKVYVDAVAAASTGKVYFTPGLGI